MASAGPTADGPNPRVLPLTDPDSPFIENYRRLYRRILYFHQQRGFRSFGITSAASGEGKTLTSINLSLVMSEDPKKKVILIECDFRRPQVARYLGLHAIRGLADVILRRAPLGEVVREVKASRLKVLPAGKLGAELTHVLHDSALNETIAALKRQYDFVIVDTPPILPIADQAFLADLVDGLVLVVRAGKTPKDMLQTALEIIKDKNLLGVVLNGFDRKIANYYHYKYSHYYSKKQK